MSARIGAVILAAGTASRMGCQKLLLPLAGRPLVAHVLNTVHNMLWADCIAIIGEPRDELTELCRHYNIGSVFNVSRRQGQTTSIKLALQTLHNQLDGVMFFLGDQPLVTQMLVQTIVAAFEKSASSKSIIVPCHQGQRYSPVLFGSYWRSGLADISGDIGGRQIIRENPDRVIEVAWSDPHPFYDADTWEDYQKLQKLSEA